MNDAGTILAPGMQVVGYDPKKEGRPQNRFFPVESGQANGEVIGDPPESDIFSQWVSGLMSPWRTFGQRAASWLRAVKSGDQERIRAVLNTEFGEMYRTRGQAPEWEALKDLCPGYAFEEIPKGARLLFLTVDVQGDRLVCTVRGWGAEFESWLIFREELWGDTSEPEVWGRLDRLVDRQFGGVGITACAVDTGYRREHVLNWCRRHSKAYPTKGASGRITKLYHASDAEVSHLGKRLKTGLKQWSIDDQYFKAWVHDHIGWPQDQPGSWHLPVDIDDDYCRQIVAEQRMRLPSGRTQWIKVHKDNHYLDCEALQAFLAHVEGVRHLKRPVEDDAAPVEKRSRIRVVRSSYLGRR
jgi:phage terminase large subunit GpA-like protein